MGKYSFREITILLFTLSCFCGHAAASSASKFESCAYSKIPTYKSRLEAFPTPQRAKCDSVRDAELEKARKVVETFWAFGAWDIDVFHSRYKDILKQHYNLRSPLEIRRKLKEMKDWQDQEYQELVLGNNYAYIRVLATWFTEGEHGVTTYLFHLTKEEDKWYISSVGY